MFIVLRSPVEFEIRNDKEGSYIAKRLRFLGLTAYGNSLDEVNNKLNNMFLTWVALHRNNGTLWERLKSFKEKNKELGVTWEFGINLIEDKLEEVG